MNADQVQLEEDRIRLWYAKQEPENMVIEYNQPDMVDILTRLVQAQESSMFKDERNYIFQ